MRLRDLVTESAIYELRQRCRELLAESVVDYLGVTLAALKHKKPSEMKLDIEHLASIVAGLKVLSNKEYRGAMTQDDVGINPSSAKELFKLFDDVAKDGNDPKNVADVFRALSKIAPNVFKKEAEALEALKSEDEATRKEAITKLDAFSTKVSQMFNKVKSMANSSDKSAEAPVASATA